ncbi:MAG: DUF2490 domain-containing protein [Bacteroidota bacterium]
MISPKQILCFLFLSCSISLTAQQDEVGNWIMYFGQNRVSDQFSIHTEIQYRDYTFAPININTEQLLLRTGLNYHFSSSAFATAGYAYIGSYEYGSDQKSPEVNEHRIWQQLIMNDRIGRVKFEHRYRIEQRWVNGDYRNRFRYRLMIFLPLNRPSIEPGAVFLGLYDEIFINTEAVFFDRNRLYGALGYQFSKSTQVQLGLLHQRVNDFGKYYVQMGLVFNPDFRSN